jgi:hypothetical protein
MTDRIEQALARIDAANAEDPNREFVDGVARPKEAVYAERMTGWLERFSPDASEALRIAARAQHIERWTMPRAEFPEGREGYHRWRTTLAKFHAERTAGIIAEAGYQADVIDRVKKLLRKRGLKSDPEVQTLEDVACLVFLENYFADFSKQLDEDKVVGIVRKTWAKMSAKGHDAALALEMSDETRALVEKALDG